MLIWTVVNYEWLRRNTRWLRWLRIPESQHPSMEVTWKPTGAQGFLTSLTSSHSRPQRCLTSTATWYSYHWPVLDTAIGWVRTLRGPLSRNRLTYTHTYAWSTRCWKSHPSRTHATGLHKHGLRVSVDVEGTTNQLSHWK